MHEILIIMAINLKINLVIFLVKTLLYS